MKKLFIVVSVLSLLLLGCGKEESKPAAAESTPAASVSAEDLEITIPAGAGEAVVPEDGDIIIPLD